MSSTLKSLIVKQVLSGDSLVLRERSKTGPPPERIISLSNIVAPRLARRPTPNSENNEVSVDEPYAWEAREFIRQLCIGQEVWYQVENKAPSGREYANVFIANSSGEKENLCELIVEAGLAEVRRQTNVGAASNDVYQNLISLEEAAKAAHRGKWSLSDSNLAIRNIQWSMDNVVQYVESHQSRTVPAIIEHVRDGCTLRTFILPNDNENVYRNVTIMLSGVKTPGYKLGENNEQIPEPHADEARFFVESKLLQRKVDIKLETVNNQNIVGTVIHPKGNIAEFILKEGFGRIVDWSMAVLPPNVAISYRAAEKLAKEKRLRLWKDYEPPKIITELSSLHGRTNSIELTNQSLTGKVVEVGNGDNITVKCSNGQIRKFFLSSIRSPKLNTADSNVQKKIKPLYDIPHLFEAREFLRKKLIGKKVNVRVDYIQPKTENLEERLMATITIGEMNVAEALVLKGLATVIRYRATDENRSLFYDALLLAESTAIKKAVGVHSKKEPPTHKISDLSGEANKARQFLSSLKRQGKMTGVVEFVAAGSRLRVYIPKETCILTILCAGIECPKAARRLPNGKEEHGDMFGNEALEFTKELCMQREIEIEIDNMDKGGNFIGCVYLESPENGINPNLSIALVEAGLSKVHFTAERLSFYKLLCEAEIRAKERKLNIWEIEGQKSYLEQHLSEANLNGVKNGQQLERVESYQNALVTQVLDGVRFYAQLMANENVIISITKELQNYFNEHQHMPGNYKPKKGDLCAAKFTLDGCWYRAKVLKIDGPRSIHLLYVDFGNEEVNDELSLAPLPSSLTKIPYQATEYSLACLINHPDEDAKEAAKYALENDISDKEIKLNVEYEASENSPQGVSVLVKINEKWENEAEMLLRDGILYVDEKRKEKRLNNLMRQYVAAQEEARQKRLNIWKYGDFRNDDGPL